MFTSHSAVTANDAGPGGPSLSMDTQLFVNRLRESVQQHQVCYEVWPEWYMKDGRKIQIGFELQLCGINNHVVLNGDPVHSVPGCPHCFSTYSELRDIAEWILPREERPSRYEIQAFDHALHLAPAKRQRRSEVIVTIVIMHRSDFNRPLDESESRCLKEVRERLKQLGIHEDIWRGGE